ncbi:hypothetical protein AUJ38_00985 [bacterium CG1_02_42_9]|nr:MAG: hypothetical protein AUJ38_00985 [bacterium CG1_02_42_9]
MTEDNQQIIDILNEIIEAQAIEPKTAEKIEQWFETQREKEVAEVTTVIPLSDTQRASLGHKLSEIFNRPLKIDNRIDEKILGGMKIKVGSQVIDATLLNKIGQLKSWMHEQIEQLSS